MFLNYYHIVTAMVQCPFLAGKSDFSFQWKVNEILVNELKPFL